MRTCDFCLHARHHRCLGVCGCSVCGRAVAPKASGRGRGVRLPGGKRGPTPGYLKVPVPMQTAMRDAWADGMTMLEIAERSGHDRATVSKVVNRGA